MSDTSPSRLPHILYWLSLIALVALPAAALAALLQGDAGARILKAYPEFTVAAAPEGARLVALIALQMGGLLLTLAILWQVNGAFGLFRHKPQPLHEVARRLTLAGGLIFALALYDFLRRAAASVLLSWSNAPGERMLAVGFSQAEITLLIAAGLLICTGRALAQGASALRENAEFI